MNVNPTKQVKPMPKVGDRVTITIQGPANLSGTVDIGRNSAMKFDGVIVADIGNAWVVELNVSISGRNRITVPKTAL